ncbi:calpain-13-like isoform X6 [Neopsephotus bourkii]|uniref:calpain-13-like isoform X6 n=1 Tax=Neopsephotus bourkii TaxID=309878 RepID=UPI002AA516F9|nr:calpain-13-like isoform X6 [Neopsephotus bourkii]
MSGCSCFLQEAASWSVRFYLGCQLDRGTMFAPGSGLTSERGWQTTGTMGSLQNLKKFNNQDFNRLRASCLSQGVLFEDATFPAHVSSIGPNLLPEDKLRQIQWKRPTELQRHPHLIIDGVSRFDIMQGEIGDCWMLAALGSLTLQKQFLGNVLPRDQGFQNDYAGIFHFRFWQYGDWVDVVIDDRLPFLNGRYLSVHPRTSNEFWPSLLEKAYAKLQGSYQHLHGGYPSDALVDFTGGVQVQFSLKDPPPDLHEILKAADKSHCLMGCSTSGQLMRNIELKNGIVQGHAYTVTGAEKIRYKNSWIHIIRIWNPWGYGEWKGAWSDSSPQWDHVESKDREALLRNKDDGEFWMSCESFQEQFSWLYICNSTPTFLDFGYQHCTAWSVERHINLWRPALATGRSNYSSDEMTSLGGRFSFDSCRGILALMDLNSNGRLTLQEFGSLWRSLTKYMDIFSREDRNQSGFLDVSELKSAIQAAGLAANDQLLRLMTLRYGDAARRIGFSDFVCCMLRLETMTYAFQNLAEGGSQILMTATEVRVLLSFSPGLKVVPLSMLVKDDA